MTRREKLADQLGMPHGTACAKLRKQIMFELIQQAGRDVCIRCDELISDIDELTIDHIQPWQDRDVELFWDLSNIGFSHARCNRPHISGLKIRPRVREDGWIWCKHHEDFASPEDFSYYTPNGRRGAGPRPFCKPCRKLRKSLGLSY